MIFSKNPIFKITRGYDRLVSKYIYLMIILSLTCMVHVVSIGCCIASIMDNTGNTMKAT